MTASPHTALHLATLHRRLPRRGRRPVRVTLRPSGAPVLDYPVSPKLWNAFRFGTKRLAEAQFASGAKKVMTIHETPVVMQQKVDEAAIDAAKWEIGSTPIFTAHQMGGCAMGDDPKTSVGAAKICGTTPSRTSTSSTARFFRPASA